MTPCPASKAMVFSCTVHCPQLRCSSTMPSRHFYWMGIRRRSTPLILMQVGVLFLVASSWSCLILVVARMPAWVGQWLDAALGDSGACLAQ